MWSEDVILVDEFCLKYPIEQAFVFSLEEYGLIELVIVEEQKCIPIRQLQAIEKFSHLYYELNINLDGIDAINHLLQKVETLQEEVKTLKNQLKLYERKAGAD